MRKVHRFKACRRLGAFWLVLFSLFASAQEPPPPEPAPELAMRIEPDARIPMRDGVELSARIWRPDKAGRFPVVMVHTPYLSDETHTRARKFVAADYVYVSVDRRGRGTSGGDYWPLERVGTDGADIVAWLAQRSWSDGRVVSRGGSYRGMAQWQTLAQAPPALRAAVPTAAVYPGWDFPQPRGIFLSYMAQWLAFTAGRAPNPQIFGDSYYWREKYLRVYRDEVPFAGLAALSGAPAERFERWLAHPGYDDYWRGLNPTPQQYARITQPILTITGYFDGDQLGALRYYGEHLRHGTAAARGRHLLLIGPWSHGGTRTPEKTVDGLTIDEKALLDMDRLHIAWFDHLLRGKPRPKELADRVTYYVLGAEEWRSAADLDAIAPHTWTLYPSAAGTAADGVFASGRLLPAPADDEPPSQYRFDPRIDTQPADWASRPPREDAFVSQEYALQPNRLFFHSAPLPSARTVCGRISFDASLEVDVPDTDVEAAVYAIGRDGESVWLGSDMIRARFRHGMEREQPATPGAIETWRFDRFWWTCRRLDAGTRLRLVIGAVDTPQLQKNYQTGSRIGFERARDARPATVRLHHDRQHPSVLRLPVIEPQ